jgi:hypothetical protein
MKTTYRIWIWNMCEKFTQMAAFIHVSVKVSVKNLQKVTKIYSQSVYFLKEQIPLGLKMNPMVKRAV